MANCGGNARCLVFRFARYAQMKGGRLMITIMILIVGTIAMWALVLWVIRDDFTMEDWAKPILLVSCAIVTVLVIFILVVAFSSSASAAENSAPAESAITVKGYTSCPTEFNPDDLGWAMHEIKSVEKKIDSDITVAEHKRILSYFPDPEQRIFVGIKKWGNPDCIAELFSYGSISGIDQKPIWAAIRSAGNTTVFLFTEKGWEKGDKDKPETFVDYSAKQYNLVFALYRNGAHVASRALPIEPNKRFFRFWPSEPSEPVE